MTTKDLKPVWNIGVLLLLAGVFQAPAASSAFAAVSLSLSAVLKHCEEKTITFGRDENGKAVKVGETLDGYCKGVLETIEAVLFQGGTICLGNQDDPSPEYLLSVLTTYLADEKSRGSSNNAVPPVPEGVDPGEWPELWGFMTPEERLLWGDDAVSIIGTAFARAFTCTGEGPN